MGVLANHVPSVTIPAALERQHLLIICKIEQLRPGLVEIIEESGGSKQFFCMSLRPQSRHNREKRRALMGTSPVVSGGFAIVQPDSALSINAVEGYPLEDFSADVGPYLTINDT